jgi:excisionase family DNA binding protein
MDKPRSSPKKIALRVPEAVSISGLSRSMIYKLLGTKQLRTVKIGRCRLILTEDLESLLSAGAK